VLHRTLKTKPGGQRDAPGSVQRNIAEIDSDQAEAAALQEQVGDPKCMLEWPDFGRRTSGVGF
jgi:hypothetical protein